MALTYSSVVKIGRQSWRYSWAATTAPYRVYLRGALIATTAAVEYDIEEAGATDEPPILEILDATEGAAETVTYPHHAVLQWRGDETASIYRVQEYIESAWTTRETVLETGVGYYHYTTEQLADVSTHLWRVQAIDDYNNASAALAFSVRIARNPDAPDITVTYDAVNEELDIAANA